MVRKIAKRVYASTKQKTLAIKKEFRKQTITAISAAFGFLIALVWRDAIVSVINQISLESTIKNLIALNFLTAFLITIIAVVAMMVISKWSASKNTEK